MSERKVLNKYFPPDFDPSKIPRLKLAKDRQYVVRLMAPCNMKCTTCSEYIYKVSSTGGTSGHEGPSMFHLSSFDRPCVIKMNISNDG